MLGERCVWFGVGLKYPSPSSCKLHEYRPVSEAVWLLEGGALPLVTCSKEREKTALAVRVRLVRAPPFGTDWLEVSVSLLMDSSVFSLAARPVMRGPASLSLSLLVRPPSRHFFMALAPRFNVVTLLLIVMVGRVMSGPTPPGHTPSSTSEISISSSGEPRSTASRLPWECGRGKEGQDLSTGSCLWRLIQNPHSPPFASQTSAF